MIDLSAADVSRIIGDELDFLRATLTQAEELFDLIEPGPTRDTMIRNNAKLRLLVAELPQKIAGHSPFKDQAHVRRASEDEVRDLLTAVTESEIFFRAALGEGGGDL
jgi:hypothetical protein